MGHDEKDVASYVMLIAGVFDVISGASWAAERR